MIRILVVLAIVLCFSSLANAVLFTQGESATLSFTSLPNVSSTIYMDATYIIYPFLVEWVPNNDGTISIYPAFKDGDSIRLNIYENINDSIPFDTQIFSGPGYLSSSIFTRPMSAYLDGTVTYGKLLWEDLEGKFTLTMLSGSLNLDSLDVKVYNGGQEFAKTLEITESPIPGAGPAPVPEPTTMLMLGTGIAGLAGIRLRRKKQ